MGREPTLICYGLMASLDAVQLAAVSMPTWLHVVLVALAAGIGAVLNRALVTPTPPSVPVAK